MYSLAISRESLERRIGERRPGDQSASGAETQTTRDQAVTANTTRAVARLHRATGTPCRYAPFAKVYHEVPLRAWRKRRVPTNSTPDSRPGSIRPLILDSKTHTQLARATGFSPAASPGGSRPRPEGPSRRTPELESFRSSQPAGPRCRPESRPRTLGTPGWR